MTPTQGIPNSLRKALDSKALTAAALLLSSASFSHALGEEFKPLAKEQSPIVQKHDGPQVEKKSTLASAIEFGAYLLTFATFVAIAPREKDVKQIEKLYAQNLIAEARRNGMKD